MSMAHSNSKSSLVENWSRLPVDWQNDERMDALFSLFKDRELNPVHYEAKMKFWSEVLVNYCEDYGLLQIDMTTIVTKFRRKGKTPKCLDKVFEELHRQNRLVSVQTYCNNQSSSWVSWTFNKLTSPLSGWMSGKVPIDQDVFVVREVVERKAQQVIETLQSHVIVPTFDCVVSYGNFIETCRQTGINEDNSINLVVSTLIRDKKILIDFVGDAKEVKVVKFIAPGTSNVRPLTEIERSVMLLRHSKERLEEQMKKSEQQMEGLLTDIQRHLKVGNRTAAMKLLRKKKLIEREYDKKESTVDHLNTVLTKIEQTDYSSLVINAYSSGVQAHKDLLKKTGLTPDAVEDMIDEVTEMLDTQNEIDDALSRPTSNTEITDMNELERELEDLLKEPVPVTPPNNKTFDKDVTSPVNLPDVAESSGHDSFSDLELRLQKLVVQESSPPKPSNLIPLKN